MKTGLLAGVLSALLLAAPVSFADEGKDESGKGKEAKHYREHDERGEEGKSYFQDHGYSRLDIPPGHYPPPGECRVWYPDRPPGQQPPPVSCGSASVPGGAWLIRHPADRPDHVHVVVYEPDRPSAVMIVGEFEIGSGAFVRVVLH